MANKHKIPTRQVHLDFHTSPDIKGIGSNFSKENFQAALKAGNVESITIFAKCHHSMCYYPTEVGTMHPHLDFDLVGAMVDAAHEIGVRAPIYITAGWSYEDAEAHPEWLWVTKNEYETSTSRHVVPEDLSEPKPHVSWKTLCLSDGNGYTQHIYEITEEICKRYKDIDGLFYDICSIGDACYCESCLKGMKEMGLDVNNDKDANKYLVMKRQAFFQKCCDILKKYHPNATIFFNGCAHQYKPWYHPYQSHFEMEDLPTAWGGYDKLPMRAKYFLKKDKGLIGMTGKFHLSWGEFGGIKPKEALKYEVATMAMYGAGASIGDHLHPDGEMEMQTYENIGYAYKYLEEIAPYCFDGKSTADIGIYPSAQRDVNEGLSNILLENQLDYDLVLNNNFEDFNIVVIPGRTVMDEEGLAALKKYVEKGGKLMLMADALVDDGKFQLDFGVSYIGAGEFDCDYLVPNEKSEELPNAPMLCYYPGHRVESGESTVYAEFMTPYFDRTYEHFCGHKNTPHNKDSKRYPAIMKNGNVVYVSHTLTKDYLDYGSIFHRRYFMMAFNLLYGGGMLKVEGMGAQGRCTMIDQPEKNRYCINMVYASPIKRGKAIIIDDLLPVYNIKVTVKTEKEIKKVYMPISGKELTYTVKDGNVCFTVPEVSCHETVVLDY